MQLEKHQESLFTAPDLPYCHVNEGNAHELSDLCFNIPVKLVVPLNILRTYFDVFSLL